MATPHAAVLNEQYSASQQGVVRMFTRMKGDRIEVRCPDDVTFKASNVADKNCVVVQFEGSPNKDSGYFSSIFDLTREGLEQAKAEFDRRIQL